MKTKSVLFALALMLTAAPAAQRMMVIEDFTATWCTYCPGAARGADELDFRAFDSVAVIAYHPSNSGDPYYNAPSATRMSYYSVSGYPTVKLDGNYGVVGGLHTGTMYPTYRRYFDTHKAVASPLEIDLACSYDTTTRQGHLEIKLRNVTGSAVAGQLHTALCESHIRYSWQGMDSLHNVLRAMYPSASGEAVSVPANDSVTATRDYTLDAAWVARNCDIVVFVQNTSTKAIQQGARIGVIPEPELAYLGYEGAVARPDSDVSLVVGVRNIGSETADGVNATLSTTDPYVAVTTAGATFPDVAVAADAYSTTPFQVHIADSCPGSHVATLDLALTATDGYSASVSFPVNVTIGSGLSDDMEAGTGTWSHTGIRDQWHQTTHASQSPTHSWYCGAEGSWVYQAEEDAKLISPYFTVGEGAQVTYYHSYALESNADFCYVEMNNGSPFWQTLATYTASSSGWGQDGLDISGFAGQTQRIRFRLISDYDTNAEGWYIDDLVVTPYVAAVAEPGAQPLWQVGTTCNPARDHADITYSIPAGSTSNLVVYDVGGHVVARLADRLTGSGKVTWNLTGSGGSRVSAGTYFARLANCVGKVLVAR
jgi:thiol-disulfide isomerase/thioredoxin